MNYNKILFIFCMVLTGSTLGNTESLITPKLDAMKSLINRHNITGLQNELESPDLTAEDLTQLHNYSIQHRDFDKSWTATLLRSIIPAIFGVYSWPIIKCIYQQLLIPIPMIQIKKEWAGQYTIKFNSHRAFDYFLAAIVTFMVTANIGSPIYHVITSWAESDKIVELISNKLSLITSQTTS